MGSLAGGGGSVDMPPQFLGEFPPMRGGLGEEHRYAGSMSTLDKLANVDQLFVKQRFAPLVNKYDISTLGKDGNSAGEPICFVKQKRMKIREEINFFADENEGELLLRLKKRNIMEFHGATDVLLADGSVIGQLRKDFGKSLLRSTWQISDASGNVIASARERSMPMAVLRRIWGFIPYLGDMPFFIPFHFEIRIGDTVVGHYNRPPGITDRYVLDLSGDADRRIDRRVAMAFTVALDALQDR